MRRILMFGGTGFIGMSLADVLKAEGYEPILISRHKPEKCPHPFRFWKMGALGEWARDMEGALAVINLAGKSVNCIKTPDNQDLILRSRVESTRTIGKAFPEVECPPKLWIQMSTAHIYGDPMEALCDEGSSLGYGFAPYVGKSWEREFHKAKPDDCRGVVLRTSFVLGRDGGALPNLQRLVRMGAGGKVGHGKQGVSWIHQKDLARMVLAAIRSDVYAGVYVASAPHPVSNREFMAYLRKRMRVPFGLPSPRFLVRIGAKCFFKTDPDLAIYGRFVRSRRLEEHGFTFQYPFLAKALDELMSPTV